MQQNYISALVYLAFSSIEIHKIDTNVFLPSMNFRLFVMNPQLAVGITSCNRSEL